MNTSPNLTPRQTDEKLAALWTELSAAQQKLDSHASSARSQAGAKAHYVTRNRREWNMTLAEAEAVNAETLTGDRRIVNGWTFDQIRSTAASLAEYRAKIADLNARIDELEATYTGWSRFFLVTSSKGHIHSSMRCSTCRVTTTYGWLPHLSGRSEEDCVTELGPALCSVCYPSAPVEWTLAEVGKRQAAEAVDASANAPAADDTQSTTRTTTPKEATVPAATTEKPKGRTSRKAATPATTESKPVIDGAGLLKLLAEKAKGTLKAKFVKSPKAQYQKILVDGDSVSYVSNPSRVGVRIEFAATLADVPARSKAEFKKGPRSSTWALVLQMKNEDDVDAAVEMLGIAAAKAKATKAARQAAKQVEPPAHAEQAKAPEEAAV